MSCSRMIAAAVAAVLVCPIAAGAADTEQVVKFKAGARSATIKGSLTGDDGVTYILGANAGQGMSVLFTPSNASCYFNVTAPGGGDALFNGAMNGNTFSGTLGQGGNYRTTVYLMRNAARRNETCKYTITFEIGG